LLGAQARSLAGGSPAHAAGTGRAGTPVPGAPIPALLGHPGLARPGMHRPHGSTAGLSARFMAGPWRGWGPGRMVIFVAGHAAGSSAWAHLVPGCWVSAAYGVPLTPHRRAHCSNTEHSYYRTYYCAMMSCLALSGRPPPRAHPTKGKAPGASAQMERRRREGQERGQIRSTRRSCDHGSCSRSPRPRHWSQPSPWHHPARSPHPASRPAGRSRHVQQLPASGIQSAVQPGDERRPGDFRELLVCR
jgi:hypothetical protein